MVHPETLNIRNKHFMKVITTIFSILIMASSVLAQPTNSLINGDFETGSELKVVGKAQNVWKGEGFQIWAKPDKKSFFKAESSGIVEEEGVDGSKALKLVTQKSEGPFDYMISFDPVELAKRGEYTFTYKLRSLSEAKYPFWMVVKDANKKELGTGAAENWKGMEEGWKEQSVSFTVGKKGGIVTLSLGLAKYDNTYWFDDLQLTGPAE